MAAPYESTYGVPVVLTSVYIGNPPPTSYSVIMVVFSLEVVSFDRGTGSALEVELEVEGAITGLAEVMDVPGSAVACGIDIAGGPIVIPIAVSLAGLPNIPTS